VSLSDHWQAVALSRDLGKKPLRVMLDGAPIVLFRTGDGVAALFDRCPHRLVELSTGKVRAGEIECPYHGWRFDGTGRCTAIPGLIGEVPHYRVRRYRVAEFDGGIFVSAGDPAGRPYARPEMAGDLITRRLKSGTEGTLLDVAENILDATHTLFVHKGLLRGLSARRQKVRVRVTGGEDFVEAEYTGEDRQHGLVSRLLEGGARTRTIGRFRAPGIVELEYWGPERLALMTAFHLRQAEPGRVEGVSWLAAPRQGLIGPMKALFFRPMFALAIGQDQRVLASARRNAAFAPEAKPAMGPLDLLRADIEAILQGRKPLAALAPREIEMEL
jgi:phenylpropionate dioxygenase-like ring-hydroxylating dioxygenase large terminal subunit